MCLSIIFEFDIPFMSILKSVQLALYAYRIDDAIIDKRYLRPLGHTSAIGAALNMDIASKLLNYFRNVISHFLLSVLNTHQVSSNP